MQVPSIIRMVLTWCEEGEDAVVVGFVEADLQPALLLTPQTKHLRLFGCFFKLS